MDEIDTKVIQNEILLKSLDEKISMKIENLMEEIQRTNQKIDKLDKKIDRVSSDVKDLQEKLPDLVDERIKNNKVNKVYSVFRWIVTSVVGSVAIAVLTKLLTSNIGA
jgi:seryl-tRNA synthetase